MKARVIEAEVEFIEQPFARVLQISSGLISEATEARVRVRVEVDGKIADGRGSIYLGDLWSWPDFSLTREERDAALRRLASAFANNLPDWCAEPAHPLEHGLRLHHLACEGTTPPALARAMCASPFDAAIHDAVGQALGLSAFSFYQEDAGIPSADRLFPEGGTIAAIRNILRPPATAIDAWWLVSAKDDLAEEVAPAIREREYGCFKIKILGRDNAADAARTAEVYRAVLRFGAKNPRLSVDSNEANPDSASVLDYLEKLEAIDPDAYEALDYLEQPTHRDIRSHPNDWRSVARRKPVFLDEGLTGLDMLDCVLEQGWSGLALKTCKGHSFALVVSAWARQHGLDLSLQDLGNPGYSAIHSFLFAAHVPMINDAEINSPQYTPVANLPWLPRLSGLFEPRNGRHTLPVQEVKGLGSNL